jgi:hypothetical protein
MNQCRLFTFKRKFLKISVDLHSALAAEAHLAEGQWLEEQPSVVHLRMYRAGTRKPIVSGRKEQNLAPL